GVSVKTKSKDVEVFTDSEGFYKIIVASKEKLIFSYLGFDSQKKTVKQKDIINIKLKLTQKKENKKDLNIGYGMIDQTENISSTKSVDKKLLERETALDMATFLKTVPGISIINSDGDLKILIRGIRSLNHNNYAMILLNGNVYYGALTDLNPRNIKSIDILKGDSATMYGSRGANGVILISTK